MSGASFQVASALEAQFAKSNKKFDETEPLSEAIDRREFDVLMGESQR